MQIRGSVFLVWALGVFIGLSGCQRQPNGPNADDLTSLARSVLEVSEVQHREGKWQADLLRHTLDVVEEGRVSDSLRMALQFALGRVYMYTSNDAGMLAMIDRLEAGARQHASEIMHFRARYLNVFVLAQDSLDMALRLAQELQAQAETMNDAGATAQAWWALGYVYERQEDIEQALQAYQSLLDWAEAESQVTEASVEARFHAGHMLDQHGEHEQALAYYEQAQGEAADLGFLRFLPFAPYHQGRIYHDRFGDAARATEALNETVAVMQAQGLIHHFLLPIALQRLGTIHADLVQDPDAAQAYYREAVQYAQTHGHERFVATALARLSN